MYFKYIYVYIYTAQSVIQQATAHIDITKRILVYIKNMYRNVKYC